MARSPVNRLVKLADALARELGDRGDRGVWWMERHFAIAALDALVGESEEKPRRLFEAYISPMPKPKPRVAEPPTDAPSAPTVDAAASPAEEPAVLGSIFGNPGA